MAVESSQYTRSQEQSEAGEELIENSHVSGQQYANAPAATPSTVTQKGKKKKGTLGIGNGAIFFTSEADKVRSFSALCLYYRPR